MSVLCAPADVSGLFAGASAALFDLDGTLIETHIDFPAMKRQVVEVCERHGANPAPLAPLDILTAVEAARRQLVERGQPDPADSLRGECFEVLRRIEVEQCASPVRIEGAAELVSHVRALGIPVGIVTRNSHEVSVGLLAHAGIEADVLVARDDVERTKPSPDHLLAALRRLGVPEAGAPAAVMMGDHPMDIQAGKGARMRTVGVLNGCREDRFAPCEPDLVFATTGDVLAALRRTCL